MNVATALTACGIETLRRQTVFTAEPIMLQQHLLLAVLKLMLGDNCSALRCFKLQQHLPLAVLKHIHRIDIHIEFVFHVATVLTACGIEAMLQYGSELHGLCCNSAYRLLYATKGARQ